MCRSLQKRPHTRSFHYQVEVSTFSTLHIHFKLYQIDLCLCIEVFIITSSRTVFFLRFLCNRTCHTNDDVKMKSRDFFSDIYLLP